MLNAPKIAAAGLAGMALAGIALIRSAPGWAPAETGAGAGTAFEIALFDEPSTLNPWSRLGTNSTTWNAYVAASSLPTLFTYTVETWDWVPSLAASEPSPLTLDEDLGLWVSTVELKRDWVWSDGTPITAYDVEFTFQSVARFGAYQLGGQYPSLAPPEILDSAIARDDYTVEFRLTRPDARYRFGVLFMYIFQRAFWQPHVESALASEDPITAISNVENAGEPVAGAFLRGAWERGAFIDRPANPLYPDAGSEQRLYSNGGVAVVDSRGNGWSRNVDPDSTPRLTAVSGPHIDSVHYRIYGSQAAGVLALQAGEVDFMLSPLGLERGFESQLRTTPGIEVVENTVNGIRYMAFNLRREPMAQLPFRQAVATLVDSAFVTQEVLQGAAYVLESIVPPGNTFWNNPDARTYGTGMSREERILAATEILESGGFSWDTPPRVGPDGELEQPGEGLRMPNGEPVPPLELLTPTESYDAMRSTFGLWVERWMREIGIPVRRQTLAFNTLIDRVTDRQDADMWILGYTLTPYPTYLQAFFHSDNAEPRGNNTSGYDNPEYDALVDEFLAEVDDLDRAAELAYRLQDILARDLPWLPLFDMPLLEAYRADSVAFPTTHGLDGIQGSSIAGMIDMVATVE